MTTEPLAPPGSEARVSPEVVRLLFVCFFLSGASGLVYEVVWLRWLVHLFGATTLAVATILTAFMGGLALGSWLGGRWAARAARPLRAYGVLELAIGGYALLLPAILELVVPALRFLGASETSSFASLSLARFGVAALLLLLPTACMGATLPLLAELAAPGLEQAGGRIGRLYAVNTAGAVLGTAVAGFLLLPTIGVIATNRLAVLLNVAVGLAAITAGWAVHGARARRAGLPAAGVAGAALPGGRRAAVVALATVGASGAVAMVYEVAWTRALALVLGSSVYAFTVMLTTFLVGLAGGSFLAARRADRLTEPALSLGAVQLAIGLAAFAGLALVGELPYLFLRLFELSGGRHGLLLALEFLLTGALILVPALLSGAVFPVAVRFAADAAASPGRVVGRLYAINTVGAIVGSFAGGFLLLPTVGIRGTLLLAIGVDLAAALTLFVAVPGRRRPRLAIAAVLVLALVIPLVAPAWQPLTMSSGVAVYARSLSRLSRSEFHSRRQHPRLLFYEEGLTTTVTVEDDGHTVSLRVNGKTDASSGTDMSTQVLIGHLPVLFHPSPREVAVIGMGSGVTVGSVLRHPVRRVAVVELEPAVLRGARFFDDVNGRPLADPRSRVVVNDARNFMLLTGERFDVIVSEPSNPWMTGAASLFTTEFFALARERLAPAGVYGQWVQLYSLTPAVLRSIVGAFTAVFPHTVVLQTSVADVLLVGSRAPLALDPDILARRMAMPGVGDDLRRVAVTEPLDVYARLLLDEEDVTRFARGARVNTDDNAYVEFTAPRTLYVDAVATTLDELAGAFAGGGAVLGGLPRTEAGGFLAMLAGRWLARGDLARAEAIARGALRAGPRADLLAVAARATAARGEDDEAERHWRSALALAPDDPTLLLDLAAHLASQGEDAEARRLVDRVHGRGGPQVTLREAAVLYRLGAYPAAARRLRELPADSPQAALVAGLTRLALGNAAGAEPLLRRALAEQDDAQARANLATALDRLGRPAEADLERQRATRLAEAAAERLMRQAQRRTEAGQIRWAAHLLREAREVAPDDVRVREAQARLLERTGERRAAIAAWEEVVRLAPGRADALLAVGALWEAEGDAGRAREALERYVAVEPNVEMRRKAEILLGRP
jgi:spermidine synthase